MKKIAIIGCAGSGKTYLSLELHKVLKLPVYHLDQYYWQPNWQRPNPEEFQRIHDSLCEQKQWIIEGPYQRYLAKRFEFADTIIFIDIPRRKCLYYVFKRTLFNYGKVATTGPKECPDRFDFEFTKWIWNFNKKYFSTIYSLINLYKNSKKIYIFKSRKEINKFIEEIKTKHKI